MLLPLPLYGQGDPFYKGKTVRMIVGFSAGGGFDAYSRMIARYMGRHVPITHSLLNDRRLKEVLKHMSRLDKAGLRERKDTDDRRH